MNGLLGSLEGGSPALEKKKKATLYAILVTAALLVLVLCALLITTIVVGVKSRTPNTNGTNTSGTGDSSNAPELLATSDLKADATNLMLLDGSHPYLGTAPQTVLLELGRPDAPDAQDGFAYAYSTAKGSAAATAEAASALNTMMADFYRQSKDNNLFIKAYEKGKNNGDEYATGEAFSFSFWVEEEKSYSGDVRTVSIYDWIYKNAYKYGFVRLYPDAEDAEKASLLRYVGTAHAAYLKSSGKTLTQYLELLRGYSATSPLSLKDSGKHSAYYIAPGEAQLIPDESKYTFSVSSDNLGGLIVTYRKK